MNGKLRVMMIPRQINNTIAFASASDTTSVIPIQLPNEYLDGAVISLMQRGKAEAHGLLVLDDDPLNLEKYTHPSELNEADTTENVDLRFEYNTNETTPVLTVIPVTSPLPAGYPIPENLDITDVKNILPETFGSAFDLLQDLVRNANWLLTNNNGRCLSNGNTIFKTGSIEYPPNAKLSSIENISPTITSISPLDENFSNYQRDIKQDLDTLVPTNPTGPPQENTSRGQQTTAFFREAANTMKTIAAELNTGNTKKTQKETQETTNAEEKLATTRLLFSQTVTDAAGILSISSYQHYDKNSSQLANRQRETINSRKYTKVSQSSRGKNEVDNTTETKVSW
jgi:hypothetical protein